MVLGLDASGQSGEVVMRVIKVLGVFDGREYTVIIDPLNERFYVTTVGGETVDEGPLHWIFDVTFYGIESTYRRI